MLNKRAYNTSKNTVVNRTVKNKEVSSKTTNYRCSKTAYNENFDIEPRSPSFPHIKTSDNTEILPCYSALLTKTSEEGVSMKDLDQLQQELEKLLSVCAVRNRSLLSELELLDRVEERHEKKGKSFERPSSPKIRKVEEKTKHVKETKPYKILKNVHDELPKLEAPKVTIPKNDTKSKFWLSVDPYCAPVSKDDIAYLEDLTQECNADVNVKIPSLGQHYSLSWNEDTLTNHFQSGGVNFNHQKNKIVSMLTDDNFFKNQKNGFNDNYATSLLLPLASALLEEKVNNFPNAQEKIEKFKDLGIRNNTSVCLDKRMRKELVDLGILNPIEEDAKSTQNIYSESEDQILEEIKKCQKELISVNAHNKRELNNLRYLIDKDMVRQELNEKLEKVDGQIMEVYNQLLTANTKDKVDLEWEAVKIIQMQRKLHKEAIEITDVRL